MQSKLNPYISFKGNARDAMEFYKSVFDGKLDLTTYKDGGMTQNQANAEQIMHGMLVVENGMTLMEADAPDGMEYSKGTDKFSMFLEIKKLLTNKYKWFLCIVLEALCYLLLMPSSANAYVTTLGGDGFIPIVYQDRVFNIFHHKHISGDPLNPSFTIDCVERSTGSTCANYPRYFSSTVGSTGQLGLGTSGTADIDTSFYPQGYIVGSRLFYAAQRVADNGIGCFDLTLGLNCGYTQLGTLAWSGVAGNPAMVDGVEHIGNNLYSIGADLQMYCLDISNPAAPVACASQPYAVNTGITGQMPAYNGTNFGSIRQIINNRIYVSVNYFSQFPAANARLTCFDTLTNARCSGWSSLVIANTSNQHSRSLFEFPNTSGVTTAICAASLLANPVECWDTTSQSVVSPPPNLFTGVTSSNANTWIWDELRYANKMYIAVSAGSFGNFGMSVCYDFSTQARCSSFGVGGVEKWDGSDGGIAVNGGKTRDYGYAIDGACMFGLGDAGVLWSFERDTGLVAAGNLSCTFAAAATTTPKLPDTSVGSAMPTEFWFILAGFLTTVLAAYSINKFRKHLSRP